MTLERAANITTGWLCGGASLALGAWLIGMAASTAIGSALIIVTIGVAFHCLLESATPR